MPEFDNKKIQPIFFEFKHIYYILYMHNNINILMMNVITYYEIIKIGCK